MTYMGFVIGNGVDAQRTTASMSDTPTLPPSMIPMMTAEKARDIGRGNKWMAQSYAEAGMTREATRCERDAVWWLAYAMTLANTKPDAAPP